MIFHYLYEQKNILIKNVGIEYEKVANRGIGGVATTL